MTLPRISRRRRRWLSEVLPAPAKHWVERQDPFYLLAEQAAIIDRSIDLIRGRPALAQADDKLFCDLGFNNRKVFDRFYAALGPDYRWAGIELQERLHQAAVSDLERYRTGPVEFVHAAAGTRDGFTEIALDGAEDGYHPNDGSTAVVSIARNKSPSRRMMAPCVDLAAFLLARSTPQTRIVIKMDVEGSEYDLLPHLLSSAAMQRIDLVLCEFHWRRFAFPRNIQRLFETTDMIARYRGRESLLLSWR
jgi:FkbM family methyltransferase